MSPSLSTPDEQGKPKLLGQTRQLIRLRHYSPGTDEAHWIRPFMLFHGKRHPRDLAESDMAKFLSNLAVEGRLKSITITIFILPSWRDFGKRYSNQGLNPGEGFSRQLLSLVQTCSGRRLTCRGTERFVS